MPRQLRIEYRLLGELCIPKDGGELKKIRGGWCLGGKMFRQELLAQARKRSGDDRVSKLKIETEEQNEFNLE
jgi:hypothetical protein